MLIHALLVLGILCLHIRRVWVRRDWRHLLILKEGIIIIWCGILQDIWIRLRILLRNLRYWRSHRLKARLLLLLMLARIPSRSIGKKRLLRYLHSSESIFKRYVCCLRIWVIEGIVGLRLLLIRVWRYYVSLRLNLCRACILPIWLWLRFPTRWGSNSIACERKSVDYTSGLVDCWYRLANSNVPGWIWRPGP